MTFHDIQHRLDALLRQANCADYTGQRALADAAETWRMNREDARAQDRTGEEPFFNFVLTENVGVFTFYESSVSIYLVPGDEWTLRNLFEEIPADDVQQARSVLTSKFNRPQADLIIDEPLRSAWLNASGNASASE